MSIDVKGAIALLVVVGAFVVIGLPYVAFDRPPDKDVLLFAGGAMMLVLGYFFGHINGTATALANSAVQLAQQAMEKRAATAAVIAAIPAPTPGGDPNAAS